MERFAAVLDLWLAPVPDPMRPLVLLGAGLVAGMLLLWLLRALPLRRRLSRAEARLDAQATVLARAEERAALTAPLQEERDRLARGLTDAREALAALDARRTAEAEGHRLRVAELKAVQEEMRQSFAALASDALGQNAQRFLALVSERFEKHQVQASEDLGQRQTRIEAMLKPIHESLTKFETQVGEIEKTREGAYQSIREQVGHLAQGQQALNAETRRLVQALRAPKTRGNWGEFQLRQLFDMAGMLEYVNFTTETTISGGLRPDAIVALPGGKSIVIDAKTPLEAYLAALEEEHDPEARRAFLAQHARQVKEQVKALSAKAYWDALDGTPDFVVMFLPGEVFYSAALEQDPGLFEAAISNRVIIASPTTLIGLLKIIAFGWQQERMAENALKAVEVGRDLHKRIRTFGTHLEKMGRALDSTVTAYNAAVSSVESRVLPAARKFETLAIAPSGEGIGDLQPLETAPKRLTAPELTAQELNGAADEPGRV